MEDEGFWERGYCLKRGADGSVSCPRFLAALADRILTTGKAIILLQAERSLSGCSFRRRSEGESE